MIDGDFFKVGEELVGLTKLFELFIFLVEDANLFKYSAVVFQLLTLVVGFK